MKYLLLLTAWLGLAAPALAQTPHLDSLRTQLRQPGLADTSRVLVYSKLMWDLRKIDVDEASRVGQQGLALARRIGFAYGESKLLWYLGNNYRAQDKDTEALRTYQAARDVVGTGRRFARQRIEILGDMANTNLKGRHFAATLAQLRTVSAYQATDPAFATPRQRGLLAFFQSQLFTEWAQTSNAPDSARRAARHYARQAVAYARLAGKPGPVVEALSMLGRTFQVSELNDSAVVCYEQAVEQARRLESPRLLMAMLSDLADGYTYQHRWEAALAALREARPLAQQLKALGYERDLSEIEADALSQSGHWREAYQALLHSKELNDTLTSRRQRDDFAQLSAEFEAERKEARIKELTQAQRLQAAEAARQQARLWGLLGGLGLLALGLAVAAWLGLRLRRSRAVLATRNQQLAQARATQDRLYSVIGHDLRTPLTALEGLGALIDHYYQPANRDEAAMQEVTAEVRQTTSQLTGLLDNLLHWAADQSGELAYRPEALDAGELLRESAALYAPAARARQVAVQVDAPAGLPPLWADRNMVLTQLRNLLGNALKVAPPGSAISLSAAATAEGLALAVADAGPGLSAAQLATLEQAAGQDSLATRLPGQRGTGLGLPLVRQLARRQRGTFALTSAPGQGTTARVELPLAPS